MKTETYETEIKKYGNSYIVVVPMYLIKSVKRFNEGELVQVTISEVQ